MASRPRGVAWPKTAAAIAGALAFAATSASANDRDPRVLALMSAADVIRAIRCALPHPCEPRKPTPPEKNRGKP